MEQHRQVITEALGEVRVSDEEIVANVDVGRLLANYNVEMEHTDGGLRITWPVNSLPAQVASQTMDYDPQKRLFHGLAGWTGDVIDIMALVWFCDRQTAAIALASDATAWRKSPDDTKLCHEDNEAGGPLVETPVRGMPGFTFADLDLILPDIEWHWEPWLARGTVTLLVGEPGLGKSSLALGIASTVVQGTLWPDRTSKDDDPGLVIWVETESCQALTRERATKWGIPKERLLIPAVSDDPLDKIWLDTPEGWAALEKEAVRDGVELVILDSLRGAYKGDENTSDTIELLGKLADLAQRYQIAVLVVHHLRKKGMLDGGKINLDRVRGSSAIVQIPRCVWAIDRPDPYMPDQVRLQQLKNNLSRFPEPCGFEITEDGIQFTDAPSEPVVETQRDKAADLIMSLLRGGEMLASEIYGEADGAGIGKNTMKRAKKALRVVSRQKEGRWWWALPARE